MVFPTPYQHRLYCTTSPGTPRYSVHPASAPSGEGRHSIVSRGQLGSSGRDAAGPRAPRCWRVAAADAADAGGAGPGARGRRGGGRTSHPKAPAAAAARPAGLRPASAAVQRAARRHVCARGSGAGHRCRRGRGRCVHRRGGGGAWRRCRCCAAGRCAADRRCRPRAVLRTPRRRCVAPAPCRRPHAGAPVPAAWWICQHGSSCPVKRKVGYRASRRRRGGCA